MLYTVYVIRARNGQLYKGMTSNLESRLEQHNIGWRWSKGRGPFVLVYKEEFDIKTEALKRERFLKSGQGREFLKLKLGSHSGRSSDW